MSFIFCNVQHLDSLFQLTATKPDQTGPFIAAKFLRRTMPETFSLGDGKMYLGFVNRHLLHGVRYKVFVRAVVDTPHKVSELC